MSRKKEEMPAVGSSIEAAAAGAPIGRGGPKILGPVDHPEVQTAHLGQLLGVFVWAGLAFSAFFFLVYLLAGDRDVGATSVLVLAFALLAGTARWRLKQGNRQAAVTIVCAAILGSGLSVLALQPVMFPAVAVTPLVCVGVALTYAGERALRLMFLGAWAAVIVAAIAGAWLLARLSGSPNPLLGATSTATTLMAAAGLLLLVLWQFRARLMGTLAQVREAEEVLRYEATHDPLTGLPNRSLLVERLGRTIERASKEPSYAFAVLFLDLDRFKHVNDSLGHTVGDELLKEVAHRLSSCVHPTDTVARLGGDEFVVLLEGLAEPEDAESVAEHVQEALKAPFGLHLHELYATASIGVVTGPEGHADPEELLRDADTAMYRAKEGGKARYAVFDAKMRQNAVSLLRLETDLRRAVEGGEFVVHYQPIVWLHGGAVAGFEAVVRWQHPERGLLSPNTFVPLAEETGLIHKIGRFVLREACRQAAVWRRGFSEQFPPSVNVNLSPTRLIRSGLPEEVALVLKETGLPGRALALELTEGAIMEDTEAALETLSCLRGLGVRVHVDDFGTGHSSLGLLHRLPVDALKIDRSFVSRMGGTSDPEEGAEIVRTILTMAHQLGMDAVAEGVETEGQLELLKEMECDYAQGYRFSRPVNSEGARAILAAEPVW